MSFTVKPGQPNEAELFKACCNAGNATCCMGAMQHEYAPTPHSPSPYSIPRSGWLVSTNFPCEIFSPLPEIQVLTSCLGSQKNAFQRLFSMQKNLVLTVHLLSLVDF